YLRDNLPARDAEFNMKVDVDWSTGKTPQEMVDQIVAAAGGMLSTQARKDTAIKGLQTFLQANDKRRAVKAVRYTVTGKDKTNKSFSVPYAVGPDIYFK